jgi:FkbM family methyltransferase
MSKVVKGIHFPDQEKHLTTFDEVVKNGTYQKEKIDACIKHCKQFRTAIDVGAHIGLWSRHLTDHFNEVHAFEPIKEHRELFEKNVEGNYKLYKYALGKKPDFIRMNLDPENTGHTHVDDEGIPATLIDLDAFEIKNVDFIKIDTEGYELFVLEGGRGIIEENQPLICVEQKFSKYTEDKAAVKFLESLGYEVVEVIHRDYIMRFPC